MLLRKSGLSKTQQISLGGLALVPDLSGALLVPDHNTLIISDLHLEQGTSLARRGLHVPPFDTAITLSLLGDVVAATQPKRLIFLGDSFHDAEGEMRLDEKHLQTLRHLTGNYETIWISGNHDPEAPQLIGGTGASEIALGSLTLRHEPSQNEFEISGHLHPGCGINQRGRRLYGKCFVADDQRLIMPAFGAYTGGLSVSSPAFHGLFSSTAKAWMIGKSAIHLFPFSAVS
jgi:uncharacterized protein